MPAKYQLLNPYPREALKFVAALERAARWLRAARRGLGSYYGLTVAQWRMLASVKELAKPSIAELARQLGISRQSAHSVAVELERRGLLELGSPDRDRRRLIVRITPAGRQCLEGLSTTMRSLLLEITNDLAPDALDTMSHALSSMTKRLRACRHIIAGRPRRSARKARYRTTTSGGTTSRGTMSGR